ncbi:hypothetical protein [Streptomyces hyaluromycini]|uniref:hypothetical protein n=1 Tax=Streptomyces hyaluromycini TaxID=1377993 RepID=UPI000B5CAB96|nr:hypothetical protein [Streptomyces hyaluromycini]
MATRNAPNIGQQLAEAQREARDLRIELDRAEGELAQALEAKDYEAAAALKRKADDVRPHVLLAEAQVSAVQSTVAALAEHQRQENAAAAEKERQERAQAIQAEARAAEQQALEESARLFDEAKAGVGKLRDLLKQALLVEQQAGHHRQTAYQARVDVGLEAPSMYGISRPNYVQAGVDESRLLTDIFRHID